jgi:hypothetical protein
MSRATSELCHNRTRRCRPLPSQRRRHFASPNALCPVQASRLASSPVSRFARILSLEWVKPPMESHVAAVGGSHGDSRLQYEPSASSSRGAPLIEPPLLQSASSSWNILNAYHLDLYVPSTTKKPFPNWKRFPIESDGPRSTSAQRSDRSPKAKLLSRAVGSGRSAGRRA